jgi:nicotinamide mononucleotide transporter
MAEGIGQQLLEGVRRTHPAEWLAVVMGVIYVLLIMARRRAGWIFGAISSAILMVLAARSRLPMNALLQFSYIVAAVYGWWSWTRAAADKPIGMWHARGHGIALAGCVLLSFGLARLLAMDGVSAFPFTDSLVACVGLFATWLLARMYLENWLYWIVVDAVSIYLYFAQGLVVSSFLYVLYLVIAAVGFCHWLSRFRQQTSTT